MHDIVSRKIHALKFLPGYSAASSEGRRRFIAESKLSSLVEHPNVGEIYDVAETEDGRLYLAMPFYDGVSLKKRLRTGRLAADEALDWFRQACLGLAAVHGAEIIHRDITPGNLLKTADGVVKLLDFGLAKVSDVTMGTGNRPLGTIEYMSPEMLLGRPVDHRTDIWSLGVVLFEMLWGMRPFPGKTMLEHRAHIVRGEPLVVPTPPEGVDESLVGLVRLLLSFEPGDRPRIADLTARLADLTASVPD
jgi:serine/threonine protein kinase